MSLEEQAEQCLTLMRFGFEKAMARIAKGSDARHQLILLAVRMFQSIRWS